MIEEDYLARVISDDMMPRHVRMLRQEYQDCGKTFGSNMWRLQKSIRSKRSEAYLDAAAFKHDKDLYGIAQDDPNYWDGSEAQKLLREDVENELHLAMKPKHLWLSREEYQVFDLDVFRLHIHQETRSKLETNYWIVWKKKKEERAKGRKECSAQDDENDDDDEFEFEDRFLS